MMSVDFLDVFKRFPVPACVIERQTSLITTSNRLFQKTFNFDTEIQNFNELIIYPEELQLFLGSLKLGKCKIILNHKNSEATGNDIKSTARIEWTITHINENSALLSGVVLTSVDKPGVNASAKKVAPSNEKIISDSNQANTFPFDLKESNDLLTKATVGIHCTGANGLVMWANENMLQLMGYSYKEYIGLKAGDLVVPDPSREHTDMLKLLKEGKILRNVQLKMIAKNGDIKYVVADSSAYFDPNGTFLYTKSFIRNSVDELIQKAILQEKVDKISTFAKEKDRFIRTMFYEIKGPLHLLASETRKLSKCSNSGSYSGSSGNLNINSSNNMVQVTQQNIVEITQQVEKCLGIVDDLSFAMLFETASSANNNSLIQSHPSQLNIRTEFQDLLAQMTITMDEWGLFSHQLTNNFRFVLEVNRTVPKLILIDKAIMRVLYNLLLNATKYCASGGIINVIMYYQNKKSKVTPKSLRINTNSTTNNDNNLQSSGDLLFSITNTITKAIDVVFINKLFQSYLHNTSSNNSHNNSTEQLDLSAPLPLSPTNLANNNNNYNSMQKKTTTSGTDNITLTETVAQPPINKTNTSTTNTTGTTESNTTSPRRSFVSNDSGSSDNSNNSSNSNNSNNETNSVSNSTSAETNTKLTEISKSLVSKDGMGLGLFVSYNILQSLGGLLECSTTEKVATFSFSVPVGEVSKFGSTDLIQSSHSSTPPKTPQSKSPTRHKPPTASSGNVVEKNLLASQSAQTLPSSINSNSNSNSISNNTSSRSNIGSSQLLSMHSNSGSNSSLFSINSSSNSSISTITQNYPNSFGTTGKMSVNIDPKAVVSAEGIAMSRHVLNLRYKMETNTPLSDPSTTTFYQNANMVQNFVTRDSHILVVDDSPICRAMLVRMLEVQGYKTDVACDGQEACLKLAHEPCLFDAVLMDLHMPIMDGLTATRICKEKKHLVNIPIIIVTAEMGEDVRAAATEAQADYFISKPAKLEELLGVLRELGVVL